MSRTVDEAGLVTLGRELGRTLPTGQVVWLTGDLGAGKTTFARALVEGRGGGAAATSPTFALTHRYDGRHGPVFHVDCYRLRHPDEAAELGWEDLVRGDLLLIEWPERAGPWAPAPDLTVHFEPAGDLDVREVTLQPAGRGS